MHQPVSGVQHVDSFSDQTYPCDDYKREHCIFVLVGRVHFRLCFTFADSHALLSCPPLAVSFRRTDRRPNSTSSHVRWNITQKRRRALTSSHVGLPLLYTPSPSPFCSLLFSCPSSVLSLLFSPLSILCPLLSRHLRSLLSSLSCPLLSLLSSLSSVLSSPSSVFCVSQKFLCEPGF